jgi:hypothetical protein
MVRPTPRQPQPNQAPEPGETPAPADDLVVVAVDGSDASVRALVWAMRFAVERGLRVEALTTWPLRGSVFVREVAGHFCEPRWRAREVQAEAVARALAAVPKAPPYELRVVNATLVDALTRARKRAVMVVMGSDGGTEQRKGLRLTEQVKRAVQGPVVVVGPDGPVDDGAVPLAADLHPPR